MSMGPAADPGVVAGVEQPGVCPHPTPLPELRRAVLEPISPGEAVLVGGVLAAYLAYTGHRINELARPFLPLDGAHYLAEGRYLAGERVVKFIHPPVFPALVFAWERIVGVPHAFPYALLTALGLVWLSIYVMLRQWGGVEAAILGTTVGMLLPVTAEIVGWGGGTNLLGLAPLALTVAATDWWSREGGHRGFLVGALLGVSLLTHPFTGVVAVVCVASRVAADLLVGRRVARGWEIDGLQGWGSVAVAFAVVGSLGIRYYSGLQDAAGAALSLPTFGPFGSLARLSARESGLILLLEAFGLALPLFAGRREVVVAASALVAIIIGFPMLIRADVSYLSRVTYLLPLVVGMAVTEAWPLCARALSRAARRLQVLAPRGIAVTLVLLLGGIGYGRRLATSVPFYSRIDLGDAKALESLAATTGTVATSWYSSLYWEPTSWFVNGLGGRPAVGTIGPWLATRRDEAAAAMDMQRLMAGQTDIEDGRMLFGQRSGAGQGDSALLLRVRGYYVPSAFLGPSPGSGESEQPVAPSASGAPVLRWNMMRGAEQVGTGTAELQDGDLVLTYQRVATSSTPWSLKLRPTTGVVWTKASGGPQGVAAITQAAAGRSTDISVTAGPAAAVEYSSFDVDFGGGPSFQIRSPENSLQVRIRMAGVRTPPQAPVMTTQADLLARYDISTLVIWRNTQLTRRFESSPCVRLRQATTDLLIYDVKGGCGP